MAFEAIVSTDSTIRAADAEPIIRSVALSKMKRRLRRFIALGLFVGGATLYRQYRLARAPAPETNPIPSGQR